MILDSSKRTLVYDCESNGLLDKVTKMWCIACEDYGVGSQYLFHDYPEYDNFTGVDEEGKTFTIPVRDGCLEDGVHFLNNAERLIAHNQLGFDQALMQKFYPWFKIRYNYPEVRDTLLESQVQWFDRPAVLGYKGVHGLAVWGARLGIRKPEIVDWSFMDALKLNRCLEDVKINTVVAEALTEEREKIEYKCGINFEEALATEHEYRYNCTIQELNGAKADAPHMEECLVELDGFIEVLVKEIEPQLPPTITFGSKVTKAEAAKAVGHPKKFPVEYVEKTVKGVTKLFEVKEWHKPTSKWWTEKKYKLYGISQDEKVIKEPCFRKLKEAREYAKEHLTGKFKYPNIECSERSIDSHTRKHFGEFDKDTKVVGAFTKVTFTESKLSQHERVKLLLVDLGWDTDEWTFEKDSNGSFLRADYRGTGGTVYWPDLGPKRNGKGFRRQLKCSYKAGEQIPKTPKVTEDSFATLPEGFGKKISEYNTYSHRRKFIKNPTKEGKGLLNNIREDGRITCGITTFGTTASRASHRNWVNAPSVDATYGVNIRKIVVAEKGCTLVGIDMPAAHPRLLADFTNNETFIKAVDGDEFDPETKEYVGEDFHTVNSVLFSLNTQENVDKARETQDHSLFPALGKGRKIGKGGSYATLYGGSGKKVALTIGVAEHEGEMLRTNFLAGLGLDNLLAEIEETWEDKKWGRGSYITVLGNYHIYCTSKHKIINYKALGSEAVVQKYAVNWVCSEIKKRGLQSKLILNMHDELLFEAPDEELEEMKQIASEMYPEAARQLGLTLDWSSLAMTGKDYSVCH